MNQQQVEAISSMSWLDARISTFQLFVLKVTLSLISKNYALIAGREHGGKNPHTLLIRVI
jgi:hypothetical protein